MSRLRRTSLTVLATAAVLALAPATPAAAGPTQDGIDTAWDVVIMLPGDVGHDGPPRCCL